MEFICKFEMHPITQLGCIVSIYGTQARKHQPSYKSLRVAEIVSECHFMSSFSSDL